MSGVPVLQARGLHTAVAGHEILRGIDLSVATGEVLAVVGPSGGGKTTLLRAFNYLTPFTAGEVEVAGLRLHPGMNERTDAHLLRRVRTSAGMVFQSFHLFPHLTVLENVMAAPRRVLRLSRDEARTRALALLDRVGLAARGDAYPHVLSGGQQQRVAIARALAMQPAALLLDEPTSALDPRLVGEVLGTIGDLATAGQTMLLVTHRLAFARRVADRIIVLDAGRVVESGTPDEVFDHPRTAAVREILGTVGDDSFS